jgi:hypothetical protein
MLGTLSATFHYLLTFPLNHQSSLNHQLRTNHLSLHHSIASMWSRNDHIHVFKLGRPNKNKCGTCCKSFYCNHRFSEFHFYTLDTTLCNFRYRALRDALKLMIVYFLWFPLKLCAIVLMSNQLELWGIIWKNDIFLYNPGKT